MLKKSIHFFLLTHTSNLSVLKKIIFALAVGWTGLIAFLCLVKFNDLPSLGLKEADKYVHFTFHFGFTLLWGYYSFLKQKTIKTRKIVITVITSFFYGLLIEMLQELFTETRHADILDVTANLSGAIIAMLLFLFIKRQQGIKNKI